MTPILTLQGEELIHPFDLYDLISAADEVTIVRTKDTRKITVIDPQGNDLYASEYPIEVINGKRYLVTTVVPYKSTRVDGFLGMKTLKEKMDRANKGYSWRLENA